MSEFFTSIPKDSLIKVLISSRPVSACVESFLDCPKLQLQDLTHEDIRIYTIDQISNNQGFKQLLFQEEAQAHQLVDEIVSKACGVFLKCITIEGRIRSRCCGLVKVLQNRSLLKSYDSFLHRTVAEFIRNEPIWNDLIALTAGLNFDTNVALIGACLAEVSTNAEQGTVDALTESQVQHTLKTVIVSHADNFKEKVQSSSRNTFSTFIVDDGSVALEIYVSVLEFLLEQTANFQYGQRVRSEIWLQALRHTYRLVEYSADFWNTPAEDKIALWSKSLATLIKYGVDPNAKIDIGNRSVAHQRSALLNEGVFFLLSVVDAEETEDIRVSAFHERLSKFLQSLYETGASGSARVLIENFRQYLISLEQPGLTALNLLYTANRGRVYGKGKGDVADTFGFGLQTNHQPTPGDLQALLEAITTWAGGTVQVISRPSGVFDLASIGAAARKRDILLVERSRGNHCPNVDNILKYATLDVPDVNINRDICWGGLCEKWTSLSFLT
ncbi:MAG: hypothetical protein Q9167_006833 [Letrouitia subvulpina]